MGEILRHFLRSEYDKFKFFFVIHKKTCHEDYLEKRRLNFRLHKSCWNANHRELESNLCEQEAFVH